MWVAELQCAVGHAFEGWFGSREDFESQQERGLVSCPHCGHGQVQRRLSAPRLNLGAVDSAPGTPSPATAPSAPTALREVLALLRAGTEDLGQDFAAEARRIHRGEAPDRAIRGTAKGAEFEALLDEGIAVFALPDPDAISPTH